MSLEMFGSQPSASQRPRPQRACDICRKRKIRCDGTNKPETDYKCSNCIVSGIECTYDEASKRPTAKSYVESLENRLKNMEQLIIRLQTSPSVASVRKEETTAAAGSSPGATPHPRATSSSTTPLAPPVFNSTTPSDVEDFDASDDEREATRKLLDVDFRKLSLREQPIALPYIGKSSSLMLVHTAVDLKFKYTGYETPYLPTFSCAEPEQEQRSYTFVSLEDDLLPHTNFPPPDLMNALIDTYFNLMNVYIPILHRQTFDLAVNEGLHLRDPGFGAVVLLVCANGSRWLEPPDPRLSEYGSKVKPGWVWFMQVEKARKSPFAPPQLYDLQKHILMAIYIGAYSTPHNIWTIVGLGMRIAQDVGIHRKKTYRSMTKVEGELYKRAFWCLVTFDRNVSFMLGRACSLQDEDFDVDPLEECDDEYWLTADPDLAFKQPPGKPSKISFLNCLSRLLQILAFASRTIYAINKSKPILGFVGEEWEEHIVAELDSALNKWIDTVPAHLRWDPHCEDPVIMTQSAALYCTYYQLQIFVHRPFLPSPRKTSRLSLASLTICTNAARSCVHVSDLHYKKTGNLSAFSRMPIFTAGIVLLLNLWAGKRSGYSNQSALSEVQKCMSMLKLLESDYRVTGRLWEILDMLYSAGDFKTRESEVGRKRGRDTDDLAQPAISQPNEGPSAPHTTENSGNPATYKKPHLDDPSTGSNASTDPHQCHKTKDPFSPWLVDSSATSSPASFDLPVHTEELERVPFHHGFSPCLDPAFSYNAQQHAEVLVASQHLPTFSQHDPPGVAASFILDANGEPGPSYVPYLDIPASEGVYTDSQAFRPLPVSRTPDSLSHLGRQGPLFQEQGPMTQPLLADLSALGPDMQPLTQQDLALADDTFELWSNAPLSTDWGDWGEFINNVSGVARPTPHIEGPRGEHMF
ncbi:fungal-specific transcription factor domain-containing protein [Trametes meyenii]|nr:fungal-specific transcription factor domain-containing protein [Trametes meyenii]